jgi:hypothetical protein
MNFGKMEVKYFYAEGRTGVIGLKWFKKVMAFARQFLRHPYSPIERYRRAARLICFVQFLPLVDDKTARQAAAVVTKNRRQ